MAVTNRSTSALLARVAGAALIAITFISLAKTPLAPRAAAQNAEGYRVDSSSANGLYITTFTTPQGTIKVNLPDAMVAGDTVSGSIYTQPTGKDETERRQNQEDLNGYVIDLVGQQTAVGERTFTRNIDGSGTRSGTIVLLHRGRSVATATIPILVTAPPRPTQFTVPTGGQQGRLFKLDCPCNGAFSPQDYVKVGGISLPLIAESPRSLVVHNTSEVSGPTQMDLRENGLAVQCPFRNIQVNLSAPKLNLMRGETTTLRVMVLGLGGMSGDQSLDLQNTSPGVIKMSGGEQQHLTIHGTEVRPDGTYSIDRTLTGVTAGGFGVTATLRWTDVCKPDTLAGPVTQPTPTATPTGSGQGPARDKLEQGRSLLAHFKFYAALAPLSQALKSYKSGGDMNGIGVTSDALGDLYLEEGQYEVALGYFQSARQAFVANKEMLNASLMISKVGETYLLLDKITEAKAAFAQFGPQATQPPPTTDINRHKTFFAYARNKLGEGRADYLLGQNNTAEADFKDLLAAASLPTLPTGRDQEATRFRIAAATNLGDVSFRKGDLPTARVRYTEAIQLALRERRIDLLWAAKAGLGKTLWALSQRARTTRLQARGDPTDRRAAHASAPPQESAVDLQADAQNAYRDALTNIERVVEGSVRGHEARTTFLATTSQVFEEAAALNAEMALASKGSDATAATGSSLRFTAEGFRIAEQGRARALLDVLADGHAVISAGVPPDLIKRRGENLASQQLIGAQLTGVSLAGETPKQTFTELEAELERLAVEFESLEKQIKAASPRFNSLVHTRSLTLEEVQQRVLDDETALLEYSLGEQSSYLWVITRQNAALFKLPAGSTMDQLAMDLRAQMIPPRLQRRNVGIDVPTADQHRGLGISTAAPPGDTAAFSRASHALYKVALAPAASMIGNRRLVIVADGALNFVPFEALVTSDRGGDFSSLDYLIKTNKVSYAPSASVIAALRDQKRNVGRNILLVADPVFSANDARLQAGSADSRTEVTRGLGLDSAVNDVNGPSTSSSDPLRLPRLTGTRIEAEQIGRLAKASGAQGDLWLDLGANEDDLKHRDIQSYRVVHVATHGVLDAMRPQFSGLVLSLVGNKGDDDGFLRTGEVFNLRLGAPLVMLSACETGLGKVKRGEGVTGLSQAFMYAGAPTVGVTLWSVADKPTAELMTDFYQRLLGPAPSPSDAIREAQLAMISGKKYSAPFYWAPFVLVGEWK